MLKNYVLLDIENPNTRGNSICAIAVVLVENDKVVEKKYSLINPEDRFDAINYKITGIDASQVQTAPTLKEYWCEIQGLLSDNIIVGHNVTYNLAVLSRTLQRYDIETDVYRYCCTLELSKKYIDADSHKLENLAKLIGYKYQAHDVLQKAMACGQLFQYIKSKNSLLGDAVHTYSFNEAANEKIDGRMSSNLQCLSGLIQGILSDGVVNKAERECLKKWVNDNMIYKQYALFARIIDTLNSILASDVIDKYDQLQLRLLIDKYSSSKIYSETTLGIRVLCGIVEGISCDDHIDKLEIIKLKEWLTEHDYLTGIYPYDKIVKTLYDTIDDGKLKQEEKHILLDTFRDISDPMGTHCHLRNPFPLEHKTFCLTGDFVSAPRNTVAKILKEKGAVEKRGVSAKLDYLIVGGMGSDVWKPGNAEEKIRRAMELREKGTKLLIVAEEELEGVVKQHLECMYSY